MKKILLLALIVVIAGLAMEDRLRSDLSGSVSEVVPTLVNEHTLYSWSSGSNWRFALVTAGERAISIEEIKRGKIAVKGLEGLKERLEQLPRHQRIVWRAGAEGTRLPPESIIRQLNRYCESNGLTLEIDRSRP